MATATRTKKRTAKRPARKSNGAAAMTFRGKAEQKNRDTINACLSKKITKKLKAEPQLVGPTARDLGIEFTGEDYTRDMLMEWSKAQLLTLLQQSGIEPPANRYQTVETLAEAALANREKLIVPADLRS